MKRNKRSSIIIKQDDKIMVKDRESKQRKDDSEFMIITKINEIRKTVDSLEANLKVTRGLETEQWLRYSTLKTQNIITTNDLKKANKRNKNMLNLFRQSVTDSRLSNIDALPDSLKKEVQRTWHQKYDALLMQNDKLRNEVSTMNLVIKGKDKEIDGLQEKLLNLADNIARREEAIRIMSIKYFNLKKRKDEQEILLRGFIASLQDELQRASATKLVQNSRTAKPDREALLKREMQRCDRLTYENSLLRNLLQDCRSSCKSSRSNSSKSTGKAL